MSFQATNDTLDSRIHASCAPLFATDLVLASGHSVESVNATVTFVKRSGRYYAVTCHHVLDAMRALALRIKHPLAPSLHTGTTVCHFGTWTPNGPYRWAFQSCRDFLSCKSDVGDEVLKKLQADLDNANADKPDIAIADISSIWLQLAVARSLEPVDLV